jgi:protoheme IX farnesyltransferase
MTADWNDTAALPLQRSTLIDFLSLTKPGLSLFSVATAAGGAYLAADGLLHLGSLLTTLFGTFLSAGGAVALNQYVERHPDSLMQRTANRPLPEGRIGPAAGLLFGLILAISGVTFLLLAGNILAGGTALATIIIYLLLYTPLKRITPLATLVGAVAGALPPMVGWAVVRNDLAPEAWTLFGLLFVWQMPHFYSLALMYRNDYARAECHRSSGSHLCSRGCGSLGDLSYGRRSTVPETHHEERQSPLPCFAGVPSSTLCLDYRCSPSDASSLMAPPRGYP